jgi:uncharacterized membrane protein YgdD (TMEM256/DUF423 family)
MAELERGFGLYTCIEMNRNLIIWGTVFILTGIILGAFGAHALKELISEEDRITFEVGVRYQFYQGLGLFILGMNASKFNFSMRWIFSLAVIGTLLFSCSIYLLATMDILGLNLKFLGPITPLGGLGMIVSWTIFLWKIIRAKQ